MRGFARLIQSSDFRGDSNVRHDGVEGRSAKRPRISYGERARDGFADSCVRETTESARAILMESGGFKPLQAQAVGDDAALVMTAFFEVVSPTALERCPVNPRTGVHPECMTDGRRFVRNNIKYYNWVLVRVADAPDTEDSELQGSMEAEVQPVW